MRVHDAGVTQKPHDSPTHTLVQAIKGLKAGIGRVFTFTLSAERGISRALVQLDSYPLWFGGHICDTCLENMLHKRLVGSRHSAQSRAEVGDGILAPRAMPRQNELSFKGWVEF